MALADAIMDIAAEMTEEANNGIVPSEACFILKAYAKQLKTAVKAAEGQSQSTIIQPANPILMDANWQNIMGVEKAKEQLRRERRESLLEEDKQSPGLVLVVGGTSDGTYAPIPPTMPVGAFAPIGVEVYELRADQKLHLSEVETQRMLEQFAPPKTEAKQILLG